MSTNASMNGGSVPGASSCPLRAAREPPTTCPSAPDVMATMCCASAAAASTSASFHSPSPHSTSSRDTRSGGGV
eukprot:scaffold46171_cov29-Tisochrysis_lutea.AAC.6